MIMIHITLAVGFKIKNTAPIKERQMPIVDGVPSIGIVISSIIAVITFYIFVLVL